MRCRGLTIRNFLQRIFYIEILKNLKKQFSFETWTVGWFRVSSIINIKILRTNLSEVLDYHAPVKQKVVRGTDYLLVPFMTKDLSKAIMMKLKAKNQYVKWPSRENFLAFNKAKNKSTSINEKSKIRLFQGSCKIWCNGK